MKQMGVIDGAGSVAANGVCGERFTKGWRWPIGPLSFRRHWCLQRHPLLIVGLMRKGMDLFSQFLG